LSGRPHRKTRAGWFGWNGWQLTRSAEASDLYESLAKAVQAFST